MFGKEEKVNLYQPYKGQIRKEIVVKTHESSKITALSWVLRSVS